MGCHIVTKDFVYPHDRHGKEYGWGWSLLTTPENLFGSDACNIGSSPEDSYQRISSQLKKIIPFSDDNTVKVLMR